MKENLRQTEAIRIKEKLLRKFIFLCLLLLVLNYFIVPVQAETEMPLMIVVENHPQSRPQAGLNQADVVYEFLVEGGITRFLAGYFSSPPDKAGPIRSLRSYMLKVAGEYAVPIFHNGASYDALQVAANNDFTTIDEIKHQHYFWRYGGRSRPHNLYTDSSSLEHAFENHFSNDKFEGELPKKDSGQLNFLNFISEADENNWKNGESAKDITLTYWSNKIEYRYQDEEDKYKRFIAGNPHYLEENEVVSPDNLVVMFASHEIVDDQRRLNIDLSGSGSAKYFSQGKIKTGRWQNTGDNDDAQFEFFADNEEKISLSPGLTWIQVVPTTATINF